MQMEYREQARKYVEDRHGDDTDDVTRDVLDRWESVLTRLEGDRCSCRASSIGSPSWRCSRGTARAMVRLVVIEVAARRPAVLRCPTDKGLYNRLVERPHAACRGRGGGRARDLETVTEDTRAYFRGRCPAKYAPNVAAASWDSVIFDLPGRESLQRVPTLEPLRGTRAHVGDLLDRCDTAVDLVAALMCELPAGRRTGG